MDLEKFTRKSQEALLRTQELAAEMNHQELTPLHLFLSLILQENGLVPALLNKAGADLGVVESAIQDKLRAIPAVSGAGAQQTYASRSFT